MKKLLRIGIVLVSVILLITALYVLFAADPVIVPGGDVSSPVEQVVPQNPIGWISQAAGWAQVAVKISSGN